MKQIDELLELWKKDSDEETSDSDYSPTPEGYKE